MPLLMSRNANCWAEAKIPTHVFSLSENALMEVHETQPADLFKHNKVFGTTSILCHSADSCEAFLYARVSERSAAPFFESQSIGLLEGRCSDRCSQLAAVGRRYDAE